MKDKEIKPAPETAKPLTWNLSQRTLEKLWQQAGKDQNKAEAYNNGAIISK